MSDPKRIRMHTGKGFIAALDQSGGRKHFDCMVLQRMHIIAMKRCLIWFMR